MQIRGLEDLDALALQKLGFCLQYSVEPPRGPSKARYCPDQYQCAPSDGLLSSTRPSGAHRRALSSGPSAPRNVCTRIYGFPDAQLTCACMQSFLQLACLLNKHMCVCVPFSFQSNDLESIMIRHSQRT
jgi:hypothetical protein